VSEAALSGRGGPGGGAARWVYRLVLLGGLALLWRLNAPGHMSVDSILALHEGRFHARETWNPAIFGWLLGLADSVVPGQALAMGVSAAILFGAWGLMAGLRARVSWLAVLLALAVIALPQVLIYPAIVWKDVWFTESTIAGFVVVAFGLKSPVPAARWGLLGLAALLFAVAGLLRQNGLILAGAAAVALAWAGMGAGSDRGWRRSLLGAGGWLALVAACALGLSIVAQPQGADRPDSAGGRGVRIVQTYDLVGAAALTPLPFHHLDRFDPTLDDALRAGAAAAYSPERVDKLDEDAALGDRLATPPNAVIRDEWLDLIVQHPGVYLKVRAADFRQVFLTPVIDKCLPVHLGADGPKPAMADLKMVRRWTNDDQRLWNYVTWFLDTPAYSHLTFALVALGVGLLLLWRRDPADLAMAGLMGGSLAFAASFFVISIACDYRYLYLVDMAAVTGVLYLALDPTLSRPTERRRGRR
jgi:hypothetical protein